MNENLIKSSFSLTDILIFLWDTPLVGRDLKGTLPGFFDLGVINGVTTPNELGSYVVESKFFYYCSSIPVIINILH